MSNHTHRRPARAKTRGLIVGITAFLIAMLALVACTPDAGEPEPEALDGTIAFLLPESKTTRYESIDRHHFIKVANQRCPECRILYTNADQDSAQQQSQAEAALTQGAQVLVLDAVDAASAVTIISAAHKRGVPVVAYDRFLPDADYYVSFDSERIGKMQGEALVSYFETNDIADPSILVVNGSPTDPNSPALRRGLERALDGTDVRILAEYDTPDWSPDKAQDWVAGQMTQFLGEVDGVYAANDGTAAGAISAIRAAGVSPVPPVTGQDAELAAVQRIVTGNQNMTVFKPFSQQARTAAELAVRLLDGQTPAATAVVDGVPSMLLAPLAVRQDTIRSVLISGGAYTRQEICTEPFAAACDDAGLGTEEEQG